jgi:hypothetical protein
VNSFDYAFKAEGFQPGTLAACMLHVIPHSQQQLTLCWEAAVGEAHVGFAPWLQHAVDLLEYLLDDSEAKQQQQQQQQQQLGG